MILRRRYFFGRVATRKASLAIVLGVLCWHVIGAQAEAISIELPINPRGTYLFTDTAILPLPPEEYLPDVRVSPTQFALTGFTTGDAIIITPLGDFQPGLVGPGGVPGTDTSIGFVAVFAGSSGFLPPGSGSQADSVTTSPSLFRGFNTDIPQDFIVGSAPVVVRIPAGATRLLFSPHDSYFADNFDPNGNYKAGITTLPPKDPAIVAMHRDNALRAQARLATLSLFGTLSGAGSINDAVHSFLGSAIQDIPGNKWGTIFSVMFTTVFAGLVGGPLGLGVATAYALMTAYYEAIRVVETKLANDPPDPNFNEIYQYSNAMFPSALGLGNHVDKYFQNGFSALTRHIECLQGQLTSNERAQGALQAGATAAVLAQSAARDRFVADCVQHAQAAGEWIGSLPDFLSSNGLDTGIPNIALAYGVFDETAAQLAPIPEPGTISLFLISAGALGVAWRRAHRTKQ